MFLDKKHFRNEEYITNVIWAFWERFRAWTINQIGTGLISTTAIFLGKLLKYSTLYFTHLYNGGNDISFMGLL